MKPWDDTAKETLWLLTPKEIDNLPVGTKLISINGLTMNWQRKINIDDWDVRYGVTAWGLVDGRAEFVL